ncbi:DOPA 4,5-dioxygenase family protein [Azotobacter vinelandii DJ]
MGLYHCHVYFEKEDSVGAAAFRDRVIGDGLHRRYIAAHIRARRAHTMPMFEIDIESASVDAAVAWLDANRGDFPSWYIRCRRTNTRRIRNGRYGWAIDWRWICGGRSGIGRARPADAGVARGNRMKYPPDTGLERLCVGRFGVAFGSAAWAACRVAGKPLFRPPGQVTFSCLAKKK